MGDAAFDVFGALLVGLAGADSLCYGGFTNMDWGIFSSDDVLGRWNRIVTRVAPHLGISTPSAARRLAMLVLSFATGFSIEEEALFRSVLAHRAAGVWSVSGFMLLGGRRAFVVQFFPDGRLTDYYFQNHPDPLDTSCPRGEHVICLRDSEPR